VSIAAETSDSKCSATNAWYRHGNNEEIALVAMVAKFQTKTTTHFADVRVMMMMAMKGCLLKGSDYNMCTKDNRTIRFSRRHNAHAQLQPRLRLHSVLEKAQ